MAIRFNPAQYDINFSFNLNDVPELVQRVSVAAAQLCKMTHQSFQSTNKEESVLHTKMISRTLTGQLSPAIYQLLSDGLLPIVNTFFGQVTNSVWRVVEASVKKGESQVSISSDFEIAFRINRVFRLKRIYWITAEKSIQLINRENKNSENISINPIAFLFIRNELQVLCCHGSRSWYSV